jgi:hypothetical protein
MPFHLCVKISRGMIAGFIFMAALFSPLYTLEAQSGFSVPAAVWGVPPAFERPSFQVASTGSNVYVVWSERASSLPGPGPGIYFARSTDGGRNFETPVNLTSSEDTPQIAVSGDDVYVMYTVVSGDILLVSTDGGQNFGTPQNLTSSSGIQTLGQGSIAVTGSNVFISWQKTDSTLTGGFADTFVAHSFDKGSTFSTAVNVSTSPTTASSRSRVAASGSNVYVAWVEGTSNGSDIHFTRSTDNGVSFEAVKNLSNNDGTSANVALDADGTNVWIAWADHLSPAADEILFTRSTDSGTNFELVRNLSNNASPSSTPALKGKGNRFYLAWGDGASDYPTNTAEEIYLLSSNNSGTDFDTAQDISLSTSVRSRTPKLGLSDTAVSVFWLEGSFRDVYYSYLEIAAPIPPPALLSIAPGSAQQDQTIDMILTGSDFKDGATLQFGGDGITVNTVQFHGANELAANVSVSLNAKTGPRDVSVINPDVKSSTLPGGFLVVSASALSLIEIARVDAEQGAKGGGFLEGNSSYNSLLVHLRNAETALLHQPPDTLQAIDQMEAFYIKIRNMRKAKKPEIMDSLYTTLYNDYALIMNSLGGNPKPASF